MVMTGAHEEGPPRPAYGHMLQHTTNFGAMTANSATRKIDWLDEWYPASLEAPVKKEEQFVSSSYESGVHHDYCRKSLWDISADSPYAVDRDFVQHKIEWGGSRNRCLNTTKERLIPTYENQLREAQCSRVERPWVAFEHNTEEISALKRNFKRGSIKKEVQKRRSSTIEPRNQAKVIKWDLPQNDLVDCYTNSVRNLQSEHERNLFSPRNVEEALTSPFYDPDFWVPRRPLAPSRVYHFNVIYNHNTGVCNDAARSRDLELSRGVALSLVEKLELRGYVNGYYHDRDRRSASSLSAELDRVIAGSSLSILLLTPGFIKDCFHKYIQIKSFRELLTKPSGGLIILSVGVSQASIPHILGGHEIFFFQEEDWERDHLAWSKLDNILLHCLPDGHKASEGVVQMTQIECQSSKSIHTLKRTTSRSLGYQIDCSGYLDSKGSFGDPIPNSNFVQQHDGTDLKNAYDMNTFDSTSPCFQHPQNISENNEEDISWKKAHLIGNARENDRMESLPTETRTGVCASEKYFLLTEEMLRADDSHEIGLKHGAWNPECRSDQTYVEDYDTINTTFKQASPGSIFGMISAFYDGHFDELHRGTVHVETIDGRNQNNALFGYMYEYYDAEEPFLQNHIREYYTGQYCPETHENKQGCTYQARITTCVEEEEDFDLLETSVLNDSVNTLDTLDLVDLKERYGFNREEVVIEELDSSTDSWHSLSSHGMFRTYEVDQTSDCIYDDVVGELMYDITQISEPNNSVERYASTMNIAHGEDEEITPAFLEEHKQYMVQETTELASREAVPFEHDVTFQIKGRSLEQCVVYPDKQNIACKTQTLDDETGLVESSSVPSLEVLWEKWVNNSCIEADANTNKHKGEIGGNLANEEYSVINKNECLRQINDNSQQQSMSLATDNLNLLPMSLVAEGLHWKKSVDKASIENVVETPEHTAKEIAPVLNQNGVPHTEASKVTSGPSRTNENDHHAFTCAPKGLANVDLQVTDAAEMTHNSFEFTNVLFSNNSLEVFDQDVDTKADANIDTGLFDQQTERLKSEIDSCGSESHLFGSELNTPNKSDVVENIDENIVSRQPSNELGLTSVNKSKYDITPANETQDRQTKAKIISCIETAEIEENADTEQDAERLCSQMETNAFQAFDEMRGYSTTYELISNKNRNYPATDSAIMKNKTKSSIIQVKKDENPKVREEDNTSSENDMHSCMNRNSIDLASDNPQFENKSESEVSNTQLADVGNEKQAQRASNVGKNIKSEIEVQPSKFSNKCFSESELSDGVNVVDLKSPDMDHDENTIVDGNGNKNHSKIREIARTQTQYGLDTGQNESELERSNVNVVSLSLAHDILIDIIAEKDTHYLSPASDTVNHEATTDNDLKTLPQSNSHNGSDELVFVNSHFSSKLRHNETSDYEENVVEDNVSHENVEKDSSCDKTKQDENDERPLGRTQIQAVQNDMTHVQDTGTLNTRENEDTVKTEGAYNYSKNTSETTEDETTVVDIFKLINGQYVHYQCTQDSSVNIDEKHNTSANYRDAHISTIYDQIGGLSPTKEQNSGSHKDLAKLKVYSISSCDTNSSESQLQVVETSITKDNNEDAINIMNMFQGQLFSLTSNIGTSSTHISHNFSTGQSEMPGNIIGYKEISEDKNTVSLSIPYSNYDSNLDPTQDAQHRSIPEDNCFKVTSNAFATHSKDPPCDDKSVLPEGKEITNSVRDCPQLDIPDEHQEKKQSVNQEDSPPTRVHPPHSILESNTVYSENYVSAEVNALELTQIDHTEENEKCVKKSISTLKTNTQYLGTSVDADYTSILVAHISQTKDVYTLSNEHRSHSMDIQGVETHEIDAESNTKRFSNAEVACEFPYNQTSTEALNDDVLSSGTCVDACIIPSGEGTLEETCKLVQGESSDPLLKNVAQYSKACIDTTQNVSAKDSKQIQSEISNPIHHDLQLSGTCVDPEHTFNEYAHITTYISKGVPTYDMAFDNAIHAVAQSIVTDVVFRSLKMLQSIEAHDETTALLGIKCEYRAKKEPKNSLLKLNKTNLCEEQEQNSSNVLSVSYSEAINDKLLYQDKRESAPTTHVGLCGHNDAHKTQQDVISFSILEQHFSTPNIISRCSDETRISVCGAYVGNCSSSAPPFAQVDSIHMTLLQDTESAINEQPTAGSRDDNKEYTLCNMDRCVQSDIIADMDDRVVSEIHYNNIESVSPRIYTFHEGDSGFFDPCESSGGRETFSGSFQEQRSASNEQELNRTLLLQPIDKVTKPCDSYVECHAGGQSEGNIQDDLSLQQQEKKDCYVHEMTHSITTTEGLESTCSSTQVESFDFRSHTLVKDSRLTDDQSKENNFRDSSPTDAELRTRSTILVDCSFNNTGQLSQLRPIMLFDKLQEQLTKEAQHKDKPTDIEVYNTTHVKIDDAGSYSTLQTLSIPGMSLDDSFSSRSSTPQLTPRSRSNFYRLRFLHRQSQGLNAEGLVSGAERQKSTHENPEQETKGSIGGEGACAEASEKKEDGSAKAKASWWLEMYKGVCHALSKPDMPYMG